MEFYATKYDKIHYITVKMHNQPDIILTDKSVAELLHISYNDYASLLISFGASWTYDWGFIFNDETSTQKFADYLNTTYVVALKLAGKI